MSQWNDREPIFLQIRQRLIAMILSGEAQEDAALPSVRQIATDLAVNPLTVTRAYQSLTDLGVVESRRGLGMFVSPGARERLLVHEREKFLSEEWPRLSARIEALGLDIQDLLARKPS
ncbi:GntR family transcriptional regulator [Arsenicitalea aurantiaca]|uniref:GntR family transcriptional regulator n=1 Tax=Arsenicitalea aurantiaca TaxID=1783274 RepID=A0A433X427_9HYPH|nr:GntR family transcriptional regulator [Arsenicitalea aurantiaca]RUT28801.1 GntR family transcriptional regulator [Arsenicitalea aurantiaca]